MNLPRFTIQLSSRLLLPMLFLVFFLPSCKPKPAEKPKIVYVNSYHLGHPSSDEIMDAVIQEFPADSFELHNFIMDTKRNPSQEYIREKAAEISDSIEILNPDIVIVSDDNAVKYIIQPYFKDSEIPVVFCGVNWSAKEYDLSSVPVTGMLEILPLTDVLTAMRTFDPAIKKLLVLNENTTTSRKEQMLLDTLFSNVGVNASYELVNDFEKWKAKFAEGNQNYDLIYISTNGAIKGWDKQEAIAFIQQHIKVPVVTCEDFMMPYAVLGMTKVASEQGHWAAQTAKQVLKGADIRQIPVTKNKKAVTWFNEALAEKINFQPDSGFLKNAKPVH